MMNLKKNTKVAAVYNNFETTSPSSQDETTKVKHDHHQPEMGAEPPAVMVTAGSLRRLKRKLLLQYVGVPIPASLLVVRHRERSSSEGSSTSSSSTVTAETSSSTTTMNT